MLECQNHDHHFQHSEQPPRQKLRPHNPETGIPRPVAISHRGHKSHTSTHRHTALGTPDPRIPHLQHSTPYTGRLFNPSFIRNRRPDALPLHITFLPNRIKDSRLPSPPKMAPPKRALFSLNLDTDADHVYQKVEDHNKDGVDRVKVLESKGPTHGHTDLSYVTRPFEKTVNRAVNEVIDGRKVKSAEGEISYSTTRTERRSGGTSRRNQDTDDEDREKSRLNVVSKTKRRNIERKYDTSEL